MTAHTVTSLTRRWVTAEIAGDTETLAALSTPDFTLVGPLGFVLDKEQWLDRYRNHDLVTEELSFDDPMVRDYGSTVVVVGVHTQRARHRERSVDGAFRATHILLRQDDEWLLAGIHLSPITNPPAR